MDACALGVGDVLGGRVEVPVPKGWRAWAVGSFVALVVLALVGVHPGSLTHGNTTMATAPRVAERAADPPFDVGAAVEQAQHQITPVTGVSGAFAASDPTYRAAFDTSGFTYTPSGAMAPMAVSLASLHRGSLALATRPGPWHATGDVVERSVSDGMRERVTSRPGEIEWDVLLGHAPRGAGDLAIRSTLTGVVGEPTRIAGGHAWQLSLAGGATARLDETIVRDATGTVLFRGLPTISDGQIEIVVPDRVLTGAVYPLIVDPTVSGPTKVASDSSSMNNISSAFDGTNYLVVWSQDISSFEFNVMGARVSGDGTVVQSLGLIPAKTPGHGSVAPDVAFNGTNFLVVWQYRFSDDSTPTSDIDIRGQLISKSGAKVGGAFSVSDPSSDQLNASVTSAGSTFYVAWSDGRGGDFNHQNIYGGRVSGTGAVLDGDGIAISTAANNEVNPAVAWNGSNFLVAWEYAFTATDVDVHSRLVNPSGVPISTVQVISSGGTDEDDPAVASNGSDFLVVWGDERNDATTGEDIYGARVGAFGTVVTGNIAVNRAAHDQIVPAVAYNGTYLVVWWDRRNATDDVFATRVTGTGTVQDTNGFGIATTTNSEATPDVTRGPGSNAFAFDYSSYDGQSNIEHRRSPK